jgi:hypothetical protein
MPLYTLKDLKTQAEWNITCSYNELQNTLDAQDNVIRVITPPNFSTSGVTTHANSKTDDGWKEHLGRIKKGSGRGNTIKT